MIMSHHIASGIPACLSGPDPCTNHQEVTDDFDRSTKYFDVTQPTKSDFSLVKGWYYFSSGAGDDIPDFEPDLPGCQAIGLMYRKSLERTEGDIEIWKVCTKWYTGDSCIRATEVCRKTCNGFHVYYLENAKDASDRYCVGKEEKCPEGQESPNGFTPGCQVPDTATIDQDPVIDFRINKEEVIPNFLCKSSTTFTCDNPDKDVQKMEVEWQVDGESIKSDQFAPAAGLPYELTHDEIVNALPGKTYPFTLTCRMTKLGAGDVKQGLTRTADFAVGYTVESTVINIKEGEEAEYAIDFTAPIQCTFPCANPQCTAQLSIEVPDNKCDEVDPVTQECKKYAERCADRNQLTFKRSTGETGGENFFCTFPVTYNPLDKNALPKARIPVVGVDDGVYDFDRELNIQVGMPKSTEDNLWNAVDFPRAQVFLTEQNRDIAGKYCYYYHDPHAWSFDGRRFEMQKIGTFVLYKHKTLPFEIQGEFGAAGRWTKICGIAVRSGGDLYVANYCGKYGFYNKFYSCEGNLELAPDVKNLDVVKSGTTYTIKLPSGAKVVMQTNRIYIYPSLDDFERTEGQCGPFNLQTGDDFTKRDGTVTTDLNAFTESWRVPDDENLFLGNIKDDRNLGEVLFCTCDKENGELKASCGYGSNAENCVFEGEDLTDDLKGRCASSIGGRRRKRDADQDADDEEDEYVQLDPETIANWNPPAPEWTGDWTEQKARDHCEAFFEAQNSVTLCKDVAGINVPKTLDDCVLDIKISGGTKYTRVHLDGMAGQCKQEASKDMELYKETVQTPSGETISVAETFTRALCPNLCSGNGQCEDGVCNCDEGFTENDCSLDLHHKPTLIQAGRDGQCDMQNRPCKSVAVHGDLFIDGPNLYCRTHVEYFDGTPKSAKTKTKAKYEHFQKVSCSIPEGGLPRKVHIEVTNDDQAFSHATTVIVMDSGDACWDCDKQTCNKKDNKCFIDGKCYNKNEDDPENDEQHCNPEENGYGWTPSVKECVVV